MNLSHQVTSIHSIRLTEAKGMHFLYIWYGIISLLSIAVTLTNLANRRIGELEYVEEGR